MEILFVTPQLPWPPTQGAAIRNYHLIKNLSERHSVSLLTFAPPGMAVLPATPEPVLGDARLARLALAPSMLRGVPDRLKTLLLSRRPDMARRLYSPAIATMLRDLLRERRFDWAQFEGIEMAPYAGGSVALRPKGRRPRWLFDEHNAEFALQRNAFWSDFHNLNSPRRVVGAAYSAEQWGRLRLYERAALHAADAVVAVSPQDRAELQILAPGLDVAVVPNGVDLAYWSQQSVSAETARLKARFSGPLIVFDGTMDFRPNVDAVTWFCAEMWAHIYATEPTATFAIVGRNPAPAIQELAGILGVIVTGAVPDTRPWVAAADVYVVPMRMGGGVRLKVLQALAMQRPIVSTAIGMLGVAATPGRDFVAANTAAAFSNAVIALLNQPQRRAALGSSAYHIAQQYSWNAITPLLEQVLARDA